MEDDEPTRALIASNLDAHGYGVPEAGTVGEALRAWDAGRPDLVVLDLGLPDGDGTSVIRRLRRDGTTPILILSARGEERDKVAALELGADDYVTKPFGLAELRARVAALLRRAGGPAADVTGSLHQGSLTLDVARREVRIGGARVGLTPREYELLKVLMSRPGGSSPMVGCFGRSGAGSMPARIITSTSMSAGFGGRSPLPTRRRLPRPDHLRAGGRLPGPRRLIAEC